MRALTTLDTVAFEEMLRRWKPALAEMTGKRTVAGQPRRRAAGAGPKSVLRAPEDKLFFILFHLKAYPTQDVMGTLFGLSQPQVCAWVGRLLPLLQQFMTAHLPARHGRELSEVLASIPEVNEVLLDGTERPISRPEHKRRRDAHYSGRRKRTTVKNVVVTAKRRVVLLTPTVPGRRHDKAEADLARIRLGERYRLIADSGLQGYEAGAAVVYTPHKKPRGRRQHWRHKRFNRKLAQVRVRVEHTISSIKRLGVLKQTLRMRRKDCADTVMLIGCGLHNFRQTQVELSF
jgi:hypothetical protein